MKNLKKVLSMALALAMALSLMTTAFAAVPKAADLTGYNNVGTSYKEAVDVMVGLGVINGVSGDVQAQGNVTREQAAKIVCTMLLGSDATQLSTTNTYFSDVAATRWSAPYIAYCVENGIVSGVGGGKFNPTGNVTGNQFAKMLLVALGYKADNEGYTGTNWAVNVSGDAVDAGLFASATGINKNNAATREQACLYAFNALKATMVKYNTTGTSITIGDTSINVGGSAATPVTSTTLASRGNIAGDASGSTESSVEFGEKYFSKLVLNTAGTDDSKRPANTWTYDSQKIGTYAQAATDTFVISSLLGTKAKLSTWVKDAKDTYVTSNLLDTNTSSGTSDSVVYVNGTQYDATDATTEVTLNVGDTVEVYKDSATSTAVATAIKKVVITRYDLTKVTKVDTNVNTTDAKNGVSAYVTLQNAANGASVTLNNTDIAGYSASAYVKDTYLAAAFNAAKTKALASYVVTATEGVITGYTTNVSYTTGGTTYYCAGTPNWNAYTANDFTGTYALYLDSNGYVLGVAVVSAGQVASDAIYTAALYTKNSTGDYNVATDKYYAQTVSMNGTVTNYILGYTTTAGKIVGIADGYAYTAVTTMTAGDYYYVKDDGTIASTTYATGDAETRAAVHDAMIETANAATTATQFYTRAGTASVDALKLYTASQDTTNNITKLTAYVPGSSNAVATASGYTGQATTATKIGGYYITSATQYIIVEGEKDTIKVTVKSGTGVALTVASAGLTVIGNKSGSAYEAGYAIIDTTSYTGGASADLLFVKSTVGQTVSGGTQITAYKMDGTTQSIVVGDMGSVDANKFYTYTTSTKDVYTLTEAAGANLITTSGADRTWSKTTVTDLGSYVGAKYVSVYSDKLTIELSDTYDVVDVPASSAVIIDAHQTNQAEFLIGTSFDGTANAGQNTYAGTISDIAGIDSVKTSGYGITFNVYVNDSGAAFIFITEISK